MELLLIIMSGLPFSGKSTIAQQLSKELDIPILSYDHDVYAFHKSEVPSGTSPAKEFDMIEAIAREQIAKKLRNGQSLIYDDLCLELDDRHKLTELAKVCNAKSVLIYLDTPLLVIEQRRKSNNEKYNRNHISDSKLRLDVTLLQPPHQNENAVIVTPDTSIMEIVNAIQTHF
ncbi:MAG: AAA family ATPase [Candidatus Levyibacteriota bacterium]